MDSAVTSMTLTYFHRTLHQEAEVGGMGVGERGVRKLFQTTSLVYPLTMRGCWDTTDDFTTIAFHLALSSAALVELAKSTTVRSLILSSHLFFCLPLLIFSFTVLCRIVFAKPKKHRDMTEPPQFSFLDQGQEFVIFPNSCLDLL